MGFKRLGSRNIGFQSHVGPRRLNVLQRNVVEQNVNFTGDGRQYILSRTLFNNFTIRMFGLGARRNNRRTFKGSNDIPQCDRLRSLAEKVSSRGTFLAFEHICVFQSV